MHKGFKMVRGMVKTFPLPLLALTDKKLIAEAESMLPYSTGIEIECDNPYTSSQLDHIRTKIPHLLRFTWERYELQFRIPSGIKGLICLYHISLILKEYFTLNVKSGIHYHIDFTDISVEEKQNLFASTKYFLGHDTNSFIINNNDWIIKALESWKYTGSYNDKQVSLNKTYVKFHDHYKTVEFRIGEMTFEYPLLIKRILHCQNISKRIKKLSEETCKRSKVVEMYNPRVSEGGPRVVGRIQL